MPKREITEKQPGTANQARRIHLDGQLLIVNEGK